MTCNGSPSRGITPTIRRWLAGAFIAGVGITVIVYLFGVLCGGSPPDALLASAWFLLFTPVTYLARQLGLNWDWRGDFSGKELVQVFMTAVVVGCALLPVGAVIGLKLSLWRRTKMRKAK